MIDKGLQFVINVFRRELAFLYDKELFTKDEASAIAQILDKAQSRANGNPTEPSDIQKYNRNILDDILVKLGDKH